MSQPRGRATSLGLALILLVAVACTGGSDGRGDRNDGTGKPRPLRAAGAPAFAVLADQDGKVALVGADGRVTEPTDLPADFDSTFAPLDARRYAFVAAGAIGTVSGDGSVTSRPCPGCSGIAVTPTGLVTAQDDFQPGFGFELVVLDDDLHVRSRTEVHRVIERPVDSTLTGDYGPAVLLGADDKAAYVGYLSRNGGVRAGPTIVAAYDLDGTARGFVVEDGIVYDQALSPDGRHLALSVGGNAGACVTSDRLMVLETDGMAALGTDPALPASAVPPAGSFSGIWFDSSSLTWLGSDAVVDTGGLHVPDDSGCDPQPDLYQRRYDPGNQKMVDDGPVETAQVGWFGHGCDAGLVVDGLAPEPRLAVRDASGVDTTLDERWISVRSAPPAPSGCGP